MGLDGGVFSAAFCTRLFTFESYQLAVELVDISRND